MNAGKRDNQYPEGPAKPAGELHDALPRPRYLDDAPSPEQIEIYRRMTPGRRLEVAEQLYRSALNEWIARQGLEAEWRKVS